MINEVRQENDDEAVRMLFVGDLMLDRGMRPLLDEKGTLWLTKEIKHIFEGKDIVVANLEGTVSNRRSASLGTVKGEKGHCRFTFDPMRTKEILKMNSINVVCLGNNHAFNFKQDGLEETQNFLDDLDFSHFGDPYDSSKKVIFKQVKGVEMAFVNYSRFKSGLLSVEETGELIKKAQSRAQVTIVYAHWGEEYKLAANDDQQAVAHHFVDCGADLIIGTHPHVVQQVEVYKNRAIFYSIGNFIFDQDFSENVRTRLAVDVNLLRDRMVIKMVALYFDQDGSLKIAKEEKQDKLFERIAQGRRKWELHISQEE